MRKSLLGLSALALGLAAAAPAHAQNFAVGSGNGIGNVVNSGNVGSRLARFAPALAARGYPVGGAVAGGAVAGGAVAGGYAVADCQPPVVAPVPVCPPPVVVAPVPVCPPPVVVAPRPVVVVQRTVVAVPQPAFRAAFAARFGGAGFGGAGFGGAGFAARTGGVATARPVVAGNDVDVNLSVLSGNGVGNRVNAGNFRR